MRAPWLIVVVPCFLLAGCAVDDPPMVADHASKTYRADLVACRMQATGQADTEVKKRGPLFLTYPISFTFERSRLTRVCMESKGYRLNTG